MISLKMISESLKTALAYAVITVACLSGLALVAWAWIEVIQWVAGPAHE